MNNMIFSVAIDGPCGAGKSSVASGVAKRLGAFHLDTGAMYRAVGLYMVNQNVPLDDENAIAENMDGAEVSVKYENGQQYTYLCGRDVSAELRQPKVTEASSAVAKVPAVRARMVAMQRDIARGTSLVMDGRDIGNCVLPNATLKVYLTATPEARAMRRFLEFEKKGKPQPFEDVLRDLTNRDESDTTRPVSPLRKADDAVEIDSSHMSEAEVVDEIVRLLAVKTGGARA